jgi:hypothetical protein
MTRLTAPPPYDMADAMRTLTDPSAHRGHPAIRQSCWLFLKEARGQTVDLARLDQIHGYLPLAPRQMTLAEDLLARCIAITPRIHARRAQIEDRT